MRVIAGTARSIPLKAPPGYDTRPTSDKTKETLFNVLMPHIEASRFLDLYSGSGGIGIEALSRGAREAVFVERNKVAASCIKDNLKKTCLEDKARLMHTDVMTALFNLEGHAVFDIVFMDPPYGQGYEKEVLSHLSGSKIIDDDSIIVVECLNGTDFDYLDAMGFDTVKTKKYKSNSHVFLKRSKKED